MPTVQISSSPQMGQVSVEVSAPANAPDRVDYVRGPNARAHQIRGPDACPGLLNRCGSRTPPLVRSSLGESIPRLHEASVLKALVPRGRRFLPLVHCVVDGVWEGAPVTAED